MFNFRDIMQQAQGLQAKMAELQEQLTAKTVVGTAGGDMVTVEANGAMEILSIRIENEVLAAEDAEMLEDLLVAAVNDALAKAKELAAQEMSKLTGGLRLPGLT